MTGSLPRFLCSVLVFAASTGEQTAAPVVGEEFEQRYALEPQSKITVRNRDGAVWISGGPVEHITVKALKRAFTPERLARINVNVSIKAGEASIDTEYPPSPSKWRLGDRSGTVDYVILIPWSARELQVTMTTGEITLDGLRCNSIRAGLGSGRLFVRNCYGDVRADVTDGGLDARWEWWEGEKIWFHGSIVNGNAFALVPVQASCRVVANSRTGKVATDLVRLEPKPDDAKRFDISIGSPSESEIHLTTTNGNVIVSGLR